MSDDRLFDDIVERELFLELVADGVTEVNAGFEVGWTPSRTRRNMADAQFRELVEAARDRADGTMEQVLFEMGKNKNFAAVQMWLYNRQPGRWKDVRRIEVHNELTVNLGLVASTKQSIIETIRERGAAALQPPAGLPSGPDLGIIDAEIVEDDN